MSLQPALGCSNCHHSDDKLIKHCKIQHNIGGTTNWEFLLEVSKLTLITIDYFKRRRLLVHSSCCVLCACLSPILSVNVLAGEDIGMVRARRTKCFLQILWISMYIDVTFGELYIHNSRLEECSIIPSHYVIKYSIVWSSLEIKSKRDHLLGQSLQYEGRWQDRWFCRWDMFLGSVLLETVLWMIMNWWCQGSKTRSHIHVMDIYWYPN